MSATATVYTPDDLLAMPDGDHFELVDGHLVERNIGAESSHIASKLLSLLLAFCEQHGLGWVFGPDCGYQCFPGRPTTVRRPDVSVVRSGRFEGDQVPTGYVTLAPDLAVEVLSPNDLDYETDQKIEDYLAAGVPLVWVINPQSKTVLIYRADGSIQGLRANDELSGEGVVPGFRCRVGDIFPGKSRAEGGAEKQA
jgi:Uma2 family endonuclease